MLRPRVLTPCLLMALASCLGSTGPAGPSVSFSHGPDDLSAPDIPSLSVHFSADTFVATGTLRLPEHHCSLFSARLEPRSTGGYTLIVVGSEDPAVTVCFDGFVGVPFEARVAPVSAGVVVETQLVAWGQKEVERVDTVGTRTPTPNR